MPSKSTRSKSSAPSSRRKANTIPGEKPSRQTQSYVVIDVTLPSHIISDRSLFTTYTPGHKVHRTAFGHDIVIEGTGDAHIRVLAAGQYICFRMRNCWHVPSSPHHSLSCAVITSSGHQVIIAARTPRILFPNKHRLAEPRLPKYVPLTKVDGYFVLKFEIPIQGSIASQPLSTMSKAPAQEVFSLHALANPNQPFAGLSLATQTGPSPSHSSFITVSKASTSLHSETRLPFVSNDPLSPFYFSGFSPSLHIHDPPFSLTSSDRPPSSPFQTPQTFSVPYSPPLFIPDSSSQPFISPTYPYHQLNSSISSLSDNFRVRDPPIPKIPYPSPPFNPQSLPLFQNQASPTLPHPQPLPISPNTSHATNSSFPSDDPLLPASTSSPLIISPSPFQNCPSNSVLPSTFTSPPFISTPYPIQPPPLPPQSISFSILPLPFSLLDASDQHLLEPHPPNSASPQQTLWPGSFHSPTSNSFPLPPLSWYLRSSLFSPTFSSIQGSTLPLSQLAPLIILFNSLLAFDHPP